MEERSEERKKRKWDPAVGELIDADENESERRSDLNGGDINPIW